jgi:hypothetical protein
MNSAVNKQEISEWMELTEFSELKLLWQVNLKISGSENSYRYVIYGFISSCLFIGFAYLFFIYILYAVFICSIYQINLVHTFSLISFSFLSNLSCLLLSWLFRCSNQLGKRTLRLLSANIGL